MIKGAVLSVCKTYRYALWRQWDASKPLLAFVMLNPSTADANVDDPTIRVCIGWAQRLGYGGILVMNLFAYRATSPKALLTAFNPVGTENDDYLRKLAAVPTRVAAWGSHGKLHARDAAVVRLLGKPLYALAVNVDRTPHHPLHLAYADALVPYVV